MLVDANLLLFAVDSTSPFHAPSQDWLTEQLNGPRRIGLPWQSLGAFVRISTHPRVSEHPLTAERAWEYIEAWLDAEAAWTPVPGERHAEILGDLVRRHHVTGNLVPDAQLAALAIEHGVAICSADTDFARFDGVTWINPVA